MHLAEHFRELVDSFSDLMSHHIKLARVELKEDATGLLKQVGKIAAFVPLLLVGYSLLCVALALFLRRFMGADAAFLLVAVGNIAAGAIGILLAARALKDRRVMDDTRAELQSTAIALRSERQ